MMKGNYNQDHRRRATLQRQHNSKHLISVSTNWGWINERHWLESAWHRVATRWEDGGGMGRGERQSARKAEVDAGFRPITGSPEVLHRPVSTMTTHTVNGGHPIWPHWQMLTVSIRNLWISISNQLDLIRRWHSGEGSFNQQRRICKWNYNSKIGFNREIEMRQWGRHAHIHSQISRRIFPSDCVMAGRRGRWGSFRWIWWDLMANPEFLPLVFPLGFFFAALPRTGRLDRRI